jgi:RNA polymerase sigma-70 factor, ECF subfamily
MPLTLIDKRPAPRRDDQGDRELLAAVAAGDRLALRQLYLAYQRPLMRFLSRLGPAREGLEEAINDTFWIVWCKAREFRGASRVSTWITGIAWRCALKAARRNGSSALSVGGEPGGESGSIEPFVVEERNEWLAHGLASLPLEQRATLELAYYLGHSCEEIATIRECPVNTVKARMFQARIKLRNLLPRLGGSDSPKQHGGQEYP